MDYRVKGRYYFRTKETIIMFTTKKTTLEDATATIDLDFNHPVKEIIWLIRDTNRGVEDSTPILNERLEDINGNDWFNYNGSVNNTNIAGTINSTAIGNHTDPFSTANLKFNGVNRFGARPPSYFKKYQNLGPWTCPCGVLGTQTKVLLHRSQEQGCVSLERL